jgi:Peptidase A4 family
MISINKPCRVILLHLSFVMLFLLSGCTDTSAGSSTSFRVVIPTQPVIRKLDLPAGQGLRDLSGDFSVRASGGDTGIALLPGEKVEIFASGSASTQPGGGLAGPEGISTCHEPAMPEPSLSCYAVIYSVGVTGRAGEVGTHVEFNPGVIGNLFLGVNAPHLSSNSGSFHITVVVLPPGTLTGLWLAPQDGFAAQGTNVQLSAYAFAQNVTINAVNFTAAESGQAPVTICTASSGVGDIYTCNWDLTLDGTPFQNGPVTLGFTLDGSRKVGAAPAPVINPDGARSGVVTYELTQPNDIYAGYAATNLIRPVTTYQQVTGRWTVPQASCSPGENSASAIWVGMTSGVSDQSLLAQLGTDSDCQGGVPFYFMWWEMFPAPAVFLNQPLQPGDTATATVAFQHGAFQLSIDVPKEGAHFSTTKAGAVSDTSIAECIVEAPTIIDNLATNQGHVAQLTDFGQVSVVCQLNNNEPIATGPQDILYQMQTNAGIPKANTSALDQSGTTFTVQWQHG